MTTKVECPRCEQPISAEGNLIGQPVVCPNCKTGFVPNDASVVTVPERPYRDLKIEQASELKVQHTKSDQERALTEVVARSAYGTLRGIAITLMILVGIATSAVAFYLGFEKDQSFAAWCVFVGGLMFEVTFFCATVLLTDIADLLVELVRQGKPRS